MKHDTWQDRQWQNEGDKATRLLWWWRLRRWLVCLLLVGLLVTGSGFVAARHYGAESLHQLAWVMLAEMERLLPPAVSLRIEKTLAHFGVMLSGPSLSFTEKQIQQAAEQVRQNRQNEQHRYEYAIEFVGGRTVSAEEVQVTDTTVTYTTAKGLVVTVKKSEIHSLKRHPR